MSKRIRNFLVLACDLAFAFIFVWFCLSVFTHGRFIWVSLVNMFAFYAFVLLIPFALVGIFYRVRRLQFLSLIALGLFLLTFGKLFTAKENSITSSPDVLRVMTYNVLVYSPDVPATADLIREENADIVFIQETSFAMTELLEQEMKDYYPYQTHKPSDIPSGLSVLSKYPFEVLEYDLGDSWVGTPILLDVMWNEHTVHVVNFHMDPTSFEVIVTPGRIYDVAEMRKEHATRLINFLQKNPGPAILAGDANDVFLNDPYIELVNAGLQDVWAEAGFGLGHTFPGNKKIGRVYVPEWLVRIDYIFATPEWDVISAYLAGTGSSDHRGVVATLHLRSKMLP